MADFAEYESYDGLGLAELVSGKEVSPEQLLDAAIARVERHNPALNAVVHLPLVLPPVVVGYLLLVLLGREGPLGRLLFDWFGVRLAFTWEGAALAAAVMAFPLMVRAMRLSLESVDRRLEAAARTLGAGPAGVFLTITLPLMAPGIVVGALLGFARSLGEFGATITFVANIAGQTRTIPSAIYTYLNQPGGEDAALRLVWVSVAVSLAALLGSEWAARRARGRREMP